MQTIKRWAHAFIAGGGAILLAACSPQAAEQAASATSAPVAADTHPISGLPVIPVTITADNVTHIIRAEVAAEAQDQSRGLMFRTQMGPNEGMLFDYEDDPHVLGFWMRNTVIPLDLIFIDPQRRIINIAANAVPYSEERILAEGVAGAVLELNGGRAAELGLAPGDQLDW